MTPRDPKNIIPGVLLLAAGIILLAVNMDWLQIDFWTLFWRFWPLLLILIGLRFLIKNPIIYAVIVVIFLGGAVWAVSYAPENIRTTLRGPAPGDAQVHERQELSEDLPKDTRRLTFKLDYGAATMDLSSLDGSDQAYRAVFENAGQIQEQVDRNGNELAIELTQEKGVGQFWKGVSGRRAEVAINPNVPLDLELDAGASKQELDFSQLRLENLKLDLGASSGTITFGDKADSLLATIDSGASSLTLRVPNKVGLRIVYDGGLSSNNFQASGLTRTEDTYQSPGFGTQSKQITLTLDAGASSIRLERY